MISDYGSIGKSLVLQVASGSHNVAPVGFCVTLQQPAVVWILKIERGRKIVAF
jgi:hypothetical protein